MKPRHYGALFLLFLCIPCTAMSSIAARRFFSGHDKLAFAAIHVYAPHNWSKPAITLGNKHGVYSVTLGATAVVFQGKGKRRLLISYDKVGMIRSVPHKGSMYNRLEVYFLVP